MTRRVASDLAMALVALIGAAGSFVSVTVLMEELPDGVLVAASCAGALLVAIAQVGSGKLVAALKGGGSAVLAGIAGGAASFALAPLLVLSQRASDAPPGTEVLLFTTSAWGLLVCVGAHFVTRPPRSALGIAASLLCGVGGVVVLANWERPSSLSPFVRFPAQHILMLVAGVLFTVGAVWLVRASKTLGAPLVAALGMIGATVTAVVIALPTMSRAGDALGRTSGALVVLAVFGAMFALGWVRAAAGAGLQWASVSLSTVPAALTALSAAERLLTVYGPNPIRWIPVGAGIALSVLAVAAMWLTRGTPEGSGEAVRPVLRPEWAPLAAGALGVALGIASLATGALRAEVTGAFGEEYEAAWTMLGIESAAGWLTLAASMCAIVAVGSAVRGLRREAASAAMLAILSPIAYPFVTDTPLRTATRWIPADVQQTLGTEYARITFEPITDIVRLASLVVSVGLGVAVIVVLARAHAMTPESRGTT